MYWDLIVQKESRVTLKKSHILTERQKAGKD